MCKITGLDHFVLTVADIPTTIAFYEGVLGSARGPITSIYLRDPDQNLIEISHYDP